MGSSKTGRCWSDHNIKLAVAEDDFFTEKFYSESLHTTVKHCIFLQVQSFILTNEIGEAAGILLPSIGNKDMYISTNTIKW